jgi:hypothetical protein
LSYDSSPWFLWRCLPDHSACLYLHVSVCMCTRVMPPNEIIPITEVNLILLIPLVILVRISLLPHEHQNCNTFTLSLSPLRTQLRQGMDYDTEEGQHASFTRMLEHFKVDLRAKNAEKSTQNTTSPWCVHISVRLWRCLSVEFLKGGAATRYSID